MELLDTEESSFVEEELNEHFAKLIKFIIHAEPLLSKSYTHNENRSKINAGEIESLTMDFYQNWKEALRLIHHDVTKCIRNPKTAMNLLKRVVTQLVLYYTRFTTVITLCYVNPPFRKYIVTLQEIMYEIRNNYVKDI
eukprot:GEZU01024145.1.p1 GENE.GEZU01024145.1~~GEZU01024145.1.p1  ORF type:complete len:138 (+),score=32.59 GEZU01024145.1:162-575(+)